MATKTRKSARESTSSMALTTNANASGSSLVPSTTPNKATSRSVPAFLNKLFTMVNDPATDELIKWNKDGDSFYVPSADRFGRELLPRFFKHSNFGSFVRQLNMYGFHKVPHLQQGVLKTDSDEIAELLEFSNPNFTQGQPDLLCLIRRQKARADPPLSSETALDLPGLLTDLSAIRKHQTALSADLKDLQTSNHSLWQEAIQSRERHTRQQDTINKILRFLATVFGGQVVGTEGESPAREHVVVEEEPEKESNGSSSKGKEKEDVHLPKRRAQYYLKDVPGRDEQQIDDGIEEINVDDFPTISRESQVLARPAMVRTGSSSSFRQPTLSKNSSYSSRFETLPSASPSAIAAESPKAASPPQFGGLPPDMLSNLLSPSNSATLAAFMQLQNISAAPPSVPIASTSHHSSSMHLPPLPPLPTEHLSLLASPVDSAHLLKNSHQHPFAPSPDFSALLPSFSESPHLNPDYSVALQENNEILREAMTEKTVIDAKTTEIETAIAKLLQTLPPETRAQLNENGQLNASGFGFESEGTGDGQGMRWGDENQEGDFLSQYVNSNNSHTLLSPGISSAAAPQDYDFLLDNPLLGDDSRHQFESVSPADSWMAGSPGMNSESEAETPIAEEEIFAVGRGAGRKKRKSDVLGKGDVEEGRKKSK